MDKIYAQNNYLVIEQSGISYFFAQNTSVFFINNLDIVISTVSRINTGRSVTIASRNIGNYYDQSGKIAYTYATLIELLTKNTSKF